MAITNSHLFSLLSVDRHELIDESEQSLRLFGAGLVVLHLTVLVHDDAGHVGVHTFLGERRGYASLRPLYTLIWGT